MKNNRIISECDFYGLTKTFKIMRITVFILLASILQTLANDSYSQITILSIDASNKKLVEVMDEIERLSEFYFLYNEKLIDTDYNVSVSAENQKIDAILDELFAGTDIEYTITDRKIILAPSYLSNPPQAKNTVTGTVNDTNGQSPPGVTVIVKGTTSGVITDSEGKYSLSNVPEDAILVFSFVGKISLEVPFEGKSQIDVVLKDQLIDLEEIVAIGYGVQKKRWPG